mgnify:CR=1 FL=1
MKHPWLYLSKTDIETERLQCREEGRDISALEADFERVLALDLEDSTHQGAAQALLDATIAAPMRADFPFHEPSDYAEILAARPQNAPVLPPLNLASAAFEDKMAGAWLGRCAGCLLGKPVEGWRRPRMWGFLQDAERWPLDNYFGSKGVDPQIVAKHEVDNPWVQGLLAENLGYMPVDDDTNYTTLGVLILEKHGRDFTPEDVANFWLARVPLLDTCTAERIAYRNFALGIAPPASATYRNPYREWIGAQIRADGFGMGAAGNPELAANFAWRDASISHVKNGIYGEMWAAAMVAAAFVCDDAAQIIEAGLGQIPKGCRLARDVRGVLSWHRQGWSYDQASEKIHAQWDENNWHDWTHTNSNASVVALGLLWGEGDFENSVCRAVQACFDTDCNGATVGSILGARLGRAALPEKWTAPLGNRLKTGVAGYNDVQISAMATKTAQLARDLAR